MVLRVILSIQTERLVQTPAVADLVSSLNQKFILLSPTSRTVDVPSLQRLARVDAAFLPLDSPVTLSENGTLHPPKTPGEIFARFTQPPSEPGDEDVARRTMALIHQLDSESRRKHPSILTVFRMYCIQ